MALMLKRIGSGLFVFLSLISCSDNVVIEKVEIVRPVKLLAIDLTNEKEFSFPGEVSASRQADIAFRVPGQILDYKFNSGANVIKGQLLVQLDPNDYQLTLNATQARYDLALVEFKRSEELVKDFFISQQDFDQSKSNLQVAKAKLSTAERNLTYTKILAPYDGVVAAKYKENHEYVDAQQPVLSIQSVNAIDVIIAIPERLITPMRTLVKGSESLKISVSFPVNIGVQYSAQLKSISTVADESTGSYRVELTLPKPDGLNLYSGMSAEVTSTLTLSKMNLIQTIPKLAFITENNVTFVWRYNEDSHRVTKVVVIFDDEGNLISGLNDSDLIVTAGVLELKENQVVKPWNKERGL